MTLTTSHSHSNLSPGGGKLKHRLLACLAVSALTVSCARFTPPERGADAVLVPDAFTLYDDVRATPDRWWESFDSEELNRLVEQALVDNLTLQQVYARLVQAEMVAIQAGAPRFPSVEYSGDASIGRRRVDTGQGPDRLEVLNEKITAWNQLAGTGAIPPANLLEALQDTRTALQAANTLFADTSPSHNISTVRSYRFGLGSSFEVDLWGRVESQYEAALSDLEATREDVYGAMLSLSAIVVREWLTAVAQHRPSPGRKAAELNKTPGLIELRFRRPGRRPRCLPSSARSSPNGIHPALPSRRTPQTHSELAVLLGRLPQEDLGIGTAILPEMANCPTGLPAELLANRPDVRAAGLRLRSADWRVNVAKADRLPALRLTGSASYGADEWDLVFNNWVATLAAGVTGPVFDAGRRKAEVERTRAVVDERLSGYREQVLEAAKEVENAMFEEVKQPYIERWNAWTSPSA